MFSASSSTNVALTSLTSADNHRLLDTNNKSTILQENPSANQILVDGCPETYDEHTENGMVNIED